MENFETKPKPVIPPETPANTSSQTSEVGVEEVSNAKTGTQVGDIELRRSEDWLAWRRAFTPHI